MACGYDAENKVIPLAFGIVNAKNVDNWGWFMRLVCNASEAGNGRAGGKRVQLHNNNKSHGPPILLVSPWHATSRRRYK
jgi:dTDP-4-dehydrorhamnose 3,5-epimerase-like enzyme